MGVGVSGTESQFLQEALRFSIACRSPSEVIASDGNSERYCTTAGRLYLHVTPIPFKAVFSNSSVPLRRSNRAMKASCAFGIGKQARVLAALSIFLGYMISSRTDSITSL